MSVHLMGKPLSDLAESSRSENHKFLYECAHWAWEYWFLMVRQSRMASIAWRSSFASPAATYGSSIKAITTSIRFVSLRARNDTRRPVSVVNIAYPPQPAKKNSGSPDPTKSRLIDTPSTENLRRE